MLIRVSAGIILKGNYVFIAFRKDSQDQGGLWEFPGGKCEEHETPEQALIRELKEECGIHVMACELFKKISHDYGAKQVELSFFKVEKFSGEPVGCEGQKVCWVSLGELSAYQFPEANALIVAELMKSY